MRPSARSPEPAYASSAFLTSIRSRNARLRTLNSDVRESPSRELLSPDGENRDRGSAPNNRRRSRLKVTRLPAEAAGSDITTNMRKMEPNGKRNVNELRRSQASGPSHPGRRDPGIGLRVPGTVRIP